MNESLLIELAGSLILSILLIVPVWRIFSKAGKNPWLSLFLFLPFFGLPIVALILAFSRWANVEQRENQEEGL